MSSAKTLLDLITTFSQDTGMKFGESKCAYLMIEREKQKCMTKILEKNRTKIQQIKEDITYKYLGFDENVSYNGSCTVLQEFKKYGAMNSVDITSTLRTMHMLYQF